MHVRPSFRPIRDRAEEKRGVERRKSTLGIEETAHLEQLLEIGKPTLQHVHLVLDIGGPFLQQSCLSVYLIGSETSAKQRGLMSGDTHPCSLWASFAGMGERLGRI